MGARCPSRGAGDERGPRDRDLQGGRPAGGVRRAFELSDLHRQPCARPHPDGDREPGHDRRLAPVLDRPRPVPRAQRLAVEPQPLRRDAAARGDRVPDRERHRGRGRLPDVADARGRVARPGARGLPRRSRRLLHLRRRHGRRLRGAARSDRLQAGGARRDRRLGRDGVRVPRDRRPARRRRCAASGSPSRASSTRGSGRPSRERDGARRRDRRPGVDAAARAQPAPPRRRATGDGPARAGGCSTRRAPTRSRAAWTPSSRSRSTATSATTAPA